MSVECGLSHRVIREIVGIEVLPVEPLFVHQLGKVPQHLLVSSRVVLEHPVNGEDQILPPRSGPRDAEGRGEETLVGNLKELHHGWEHTSVTAVDFVVL